MDNAGGTPPAATPQPHHVTTPVKAMSGQEQPPPWSTLPTPTPPHLLTVRGIGVITAGPYSPLPRSPWRLPQRISTCRDPGHDRGQLRTYLQTNSVDSCVIQKIDINFADHKTLLARLGNHPYISDKALRKLLKERQLKGGWSNLTELVKITY